MSDGLNREGFAGIEVTHDPEIPVRLVQLRLCDPCLDGVGGECHTPGCSLWINRAPDLAIRNGVSVVILDEPPAEPQPAPGFRLITDTSGVRHMVDAGGVRQLTEEQPGIWDLALAASDWHGIVQFAKGVLGAPDPERGEIRTCYCGTTATVVPGVFPHSDCDGSVRLEPQPAPELAAAIQDVIDRYPEREPAPELVQRVANALADRQVLVIVGEIAEPHTLARPHDLAVQLLSAIGARLADDQPQPAPEPATDPELTGHVSVRFPAGMIAAAERLAEAEGMTVSAWIRREVGREAGPREQPARDSEAAELRAVLDMIWRMCQKPGEADGGRLAARITGLIKNSGMEPF